MSGGKQKKRSTTTKREDRETSSSSSSSAASSKKPASDAKLWLGMGAVVVALAVLVGWSIAHPDQTTGEDGGAPFGENDNNNDNITESESDGGAHTPRAGFSRPAGASADLSVLSEKSEDALKALATVTEISKRLEPKYCGNACEAVRKFLGDEDTFTIEVIAAEDLLLPPHDTMDTVAADLTPTERETIAKRTNAIRVRTDGPMTAEQMPARAAFAAVSILADAVGGVIYDEAARRIESARTFNSHAITAPLGQPVFLPRQIVVQLYRQEDGTARLVTLGMSRLGSPDLTMHGANMSAGPLLANVMNVVAEQIAAGKNASSFTVTLDDLARLLHKKATDINPNAAGARPVVLDVTTGVQQEADPDDLAELVPKGGSTREAFDEVIASLYGPPTSANIPLDDKELTDVATKARRDLGAAIKRFDHGEGNLFVKGPFAIPEEARVDGGAASEQLWIQAASCDDKACTGALSNEPTQAMNLAIGKTVSVTRKETVDWMIELRDGGTAGGESIKVLKSRVGK